MVGCGARSPREIAPTALIDTGRRRFQSGESKQGRDGFTSPPGYCFTATILARLLPGPPRSSPAANPCSALLGAIRADKYPP
jgi:hypothetical protein